MSLYKSIENRATQEQIERVCNEIDNLKVQIGMVVTGTEENKVVLSAFIKETKKAIEGIKESPVWKGTI